MLAAWAVRVCMAGVLGATWDTQVASGCSPPWLGGAPGPQTPAATYNKYSPRGWYPMGLRPDLQR